MVFRDLLEYCKLRAIADAIQPSEEARYREVCRYYSEAFHTPLDRVYELDLEHVMLNVFEHQLEDYDVRQNIDHLREQIHRIENPNFDSHEEEALQDTIRQLEEENERLEEERKLKASEKEPVDPIPPGGRRAGGVNFSHLKSED
jgi:chemotaxis protein histidine kinase CheA